MVFKLGGAGEMYVILWGMMHAIGLQQCVFI